MLTRPRPDPNRPGSGHADRATGVLRAIAAPVRISIRSLQLELRGALAQAGFAHRRGLARTGRHASRPHRLQAHPLDTTPIGFDPKTLALRIEGAFQDAWRMWTASSRHLPRLVLGSASFRDRGIPLAVVALVLITSV